MTGDEVRRLDGILRNDADHPQQPSDERQSPTVIDRTRGLFGARGSRALLSRYLVIGALSIVIDVGLLYLLHTVFDVQLGIATAVAFVASLIFNFICNRIAMAGSETERLVRHAFRYGLLVVANLCITVAVVTGAERIGVPYVIGKLAVVAASTCWNFVLYRRWVFARCDGRAT
jgi:putative flippase GtrA